VGAEAGAGRASLRTRSARPAWRGDSFPASSARGGTGPVPPAGPGRCPILEAVGVTWPRGNGVGRGGPRKGPGAGPASGLPARGLRRFAEGNASAVRHRAYARLQLSAAAAETADTLRSLVVVYDDADEAALQAFGMVLEQSKAAAAALEQATAEGRREDALRLSQDARGWLGVALKYADAFGMTPRSRVALGLDLVRGQAASLTLTRLARLADAEDEGAA